jgi:hypothetical protein
MNDLHCPNRMRQMQVESLAEADLGGDNDRDPFPARNRMNDELIRAIDLALENQWDASHGIVQQHDGDRTANWIHAVLHKIEGDRSNSLYWYHRAGKTELADHEPIAELKMIRAEIEGK